MGRLPKKTINIKPGTLHSLDGRHSSFELFSEILSRQYSANWPYIKFLKCKEWNIFVLEEVVFFGTPYLLVMALSKLEGNEAFHKGYLKKKEFLALTTTKKF